MHIDKNDEAKKWLESAANSQAGGAIHAYVSHSIVYWWFSIWALCLLHAVQERCSSATKKITTMTDLTCIDISSEMEDSPELNHNYTNIISHHYFQSTMWLKYVIILLRIHPHGKQNLSTPSTVINMILPPTRCNHNILVKYPQIN